MITVKNNVCHTLQRKNINFLGKPFASQENNKPAHDTIAIMGPDNNNNNNNNNINKGCATNCSGLTPENLNILRRLYKRNINKDIIQKIVHLLTENKLSEKEVNAIIAIYEKISPDKVNSQQNTLDYFKVFLMENPIDFEEFTNYIKEAQLDPSIIDKHLSKYNTEQFLLFFAWHYLNNTKEFNEATLGLENNLTQHFEQNYVSAVKLNTLLTAQPLACREIGEVPSEWLDKVEDKQKAKKAIYEAIEDFIKNQDCEALSNSLQKTLNKPVFVDPQTMEGSMGIVHRISIKDAKDVCLKIFKENQCKLPDRYGKVFEPQVGLFLNKHSSKFVKMYFGKVCDRYSKNAFLVTQFLDKNTVPEKGEDSDEYDFWYGDYKEANVINGMLIDYGGVDIAPRMRDFV